MAPQIFSTVTGALALFSVASGTDVQLTGDVIDVGGLNLLQTRARVAKHSFFFWSEPEPTNMPPLALAETHSGGAVPVKAAVPQVAPPIVIDASWAVGHASLETDLTAFISSVKSPEFISHEAVQHIGQDCWEGCSKKGGFCAWCGAGNACCRSGWDRNPPECVGFTTYKTKKHECVGPASGGAEAELVLGNSSTPLLATAHSSAASAANVSSSQSSGADAAGSGAAATNGTDNSTRRVGHEHNSSHTSSHNSSHKANGTRVHYHAGDAQHDWRPLPVGGMNAPLTSWGFSVVQGLRSSPEASRFIRRLIEGMQCRVVNEGDYHSFLTTYYNEQNQTYDNLMKDLDALCDARSSNKTDGSWLERDKEAKDKDKDEAADKDKDKEESKDKDEEKKEKAVGAGAANVTDEDKDEAAKAMAPDEEKKQKAVGSGAMNVTDEVPMEMTSNNVTMLATGLAVQEPLKMSPENVSFVAVGSDGIGTE